MAWRLAKSLETLRSQVNSAYPNRNKASDGTIGDQSHASGASDHNPNGAGVVTALDLTHDPKNGFDAHKTANNLLSKRHPNLKYIISNSRIGGSHTGWKWQSYSGSNPHDKHIHVSVGRGNDGSSTQPYDDTIKWNIEGDEMLTNKNHLKALTRQFLGKDPSKDTSKYLGKPYSYAVDKFYKARKDLPSLLKENAKLKAELAEAKKAQYTDVGVLEYLKIRLGK